MSVGSHLRIQAQGARRLLESLPNPPFARLNYDELLGTEPADGGGESSQEIAVISCLVELAVMHKDASLAKCVPKVTHGAQEDSDASLVRPDVHGFLGHLCHPHGVLLSVKSIKAGRIAIQLVTEDNDQMPRPRFGMKSHGR